MKDMLASLPQYQEQREKVRPSVAHPIHTPYSILTRPRPRPRSRAQFSLHLNMAQECMDIFERDKLPAVASVEQVPSRPALRRADLLTR